MLLSQNRVPSVQSFCVFYCTMGSTDASLDYSGLASELEELAGTKSGISLPSVQQLYKIGGLLHRQQQTDLDLLSAYQHLIDSLPEAYLIQVFQTYYKATSMLFQQSSQSQSLDDLVLATEALSGLLSNSPRLCHIAYSKDWLSLLASIFDKFVLYSMQQKQTVLSASSFLWLDGLFLVKKTGSLTIEEQILNAIQAIEEQSTDFLHDLQEWQSQSEPFRRTLENCIQKLPANFNDENDTMQQREYILNMLESARQREVNAVTSTDTSMPSSGKNQVSKVPAAKQVSAADELERRIQQVKQILPDLGEGFIETALSLHRGDVETTVSILLNDPSQYPTVLRVLDRSLPRRRKQRAEDELEESAEARQIVKERVALEEKQVQERYKALLYVENQQRETEEQKAISCMKDEYDDDYDDQYDEIDVKLGGADDGFYDFEQVKLYNQIVREDESVDSFWEENRNTNRVATNKGSGDNDNDSNNQRKQYRGPDKIKGGRIVGPDGKIVRNQGRGKQNKSGQQSQQKQDAGGDASSGAEQPGQQKAGGKPKTKPKAKNRINRQRDKKQQKQGTFGS